VTCKFNTVTLKLKDFSRSQAVTYAVCHVHSMSRTRCKIETLLLETANRKSYVDYRVSTPMTLSDVQGHAHNAGVLECDFSYNSAAVDNISTEIVRRAVPLRYLSFFFMKC